MWKTKSFRVRMKAESYQDEMKVRTSVMDVKEVDYASASAHLLQQLAAWG
jgi:hypothetical protein